MGTSTISLRVNEEEKGVLENAAKLYGCGLSSIIKKLVFEKLEDDHDWKIVEEHEKEKANGTLETRPIEELWKEIGFEDGLRSINNKKI